MKFEIGTKFNDVLTKELIKNWGTDSVILNGATGSGKTYFVENNLYKYAEENMKSILYLCNRTALFHQVLLEVKEEGLHNIDVMLYQTLQAKILKGEDILHYDYIACDEWHYVLSDAMFNIYTDLSYDWIMEQKDTCKIFMSGTAIDMFAKLKNDKIVKEEFEYIIPYDYDYVSECKFFKDKYEVMNIINHVLTNTEDKVIYFANSIEFALDVRNQFKEYTNFRCSTHSKNDEAKELNEVDCIEAYTRDLITFDERLLITTKALDNGVDIRDKSIKHVICDIFDLESAQQALGRKRKIDGEDKCTFYIRNYSKKSIGNFKGGLHTIYNPVDMFVNEREEFDKTYGKDRKFHSPYIYYDGDKRLHNKLAYWKMICEESDIASMELITYKETILGRLGETMTNIVDLDELEEYKLKDEIEMYLDELKGNRIYVKSELQKALIDKLNITDSKNRQQSSIGQINKYIQENYKKSVTKNTDNDRKLEDGSVNPNRGKVYWNIVDGVIE